MARHLSDFVVKIAMYIMTVIQIHITLFYGKKQTVHGKGIIPSSTIFTGSSSSVYSSSSSNLDDNNNKQQGPSSSCPFQATKQFVGRCAFLYSNFNNFPFLKGPKNSKKLPMKYSTQALSFLTSKPVLMNVDLDRFHINSPSPRHMNFALQASTIDNNVQSNVETDGKKKKKKAGNLEVLVIGLSHHNAGVDVREKLAIPEDQWNNASAALCEYASVSEATVLSTCNRFEIYMAGPNQYECIRDALDYLEKRTGGTVDQKTLR